MSMQYVDDALRGRLLLPTIPRVVRHAIALLRDPTGSLHELTAELAQDPVLTARVLRLANSSYFAGRRSLASIDDAVAIVGTQALSTLLTASGLSAAFVQVEGVHLRDFWMHAGVTAVAARWLARECRADQDAAYLAGLLHESGHLILCQAFPAQARSCFAHRQACHGAVLATLERQAFGADHAQVGAYWCDCMQLPETVTQAVAGALQPDKTDGADRADGDSLACLVTLASSLAADVSVESGASDALAHLDRQLLMRARLDVDHFERGFGDRYTALRLAGADL